MDIGPEVRRFRAEPVTSPVPDEPPVPDETLAVREPAVSQPAGSRSADAADAADPADDAADAVPEGAPARARA